MSDRFPGKAPAPLPPGRGPAIWPVSGRTRAARMAQVTDALRPAATGSAHARPPADPPRAHEIIPEQNGPDAGYRCGTCLLAIIPTDYIGGRPWRHAHPGDLA